MTLPDPLPLFPLQTVLFPGGLLPLKVFEARYLDLVGHCLRSGEPFGVVCMSRGTETGDNSEGVRIERVGVLARIDDVDAEQAGILKVRCVGGSRFRLREAPVQQPNGLWVGPAELIEDDAPRLPERALQPAVEALQQAQVATVLGYYGRFLERFPDVQALAAAPLDDVLALWSGLGYYSRARNLHRCAQAVVSQHGGLFPPSSQALATLPGIGPSTAAAIAAFCFGERAAILDGNVKRVLTRALGFDGDLAQPAQERRLWEQARALLPAQGVEAYTQGLMDLGSGVCTLRRPACERCPLQDTCVGRRQARPFWFRTR